MVLASGLPYTKADSFLMTGGMIVAEMSPRNSARMKPYFRLDISASYYHRFFTLVDGKDTMYHPCLLSGELATNRAGAVTVMRGWTMVGKGWRPLYSLGETVNIKFCRVKEDIWQFWDGFDGISTISTMGFFPVTSNPPTNMQGAYGYWAGYGATYATVTIK